MAKHDALKENLYNFYTANKHLSRKEITNNLLYRVRAKLDIYSLLL